jgi:hypothetical protein
LCCFSNDNVSRLYFKIIKLHVFLDVDWPTKANIAEALIPKIIRPKLPEITETLKMLYKDDNPLNSFVNACGLISDKHEIPLPSTSRFMTLVNDAFTGVNFIFCFIVYYIYIIYT